MGGDDVSTSTAWMLWPPRIITSFARRRCTGSPPGRACRCRRFAATRRPRWPRWPRDRRDIRGPPGDVQLDATELARRDLDPVLVDAADLGGRERLPHRSGPAHGLALRHQAVDGAGLGHPVVVGHESVGHLGLEAVDSRRRQRGAAHRADLDHAQVGRLEARVDEQQLHHGRHQEHGQRPLGVDDVEPHVGVEFGRSGRDHSHLHGAEHEADPGEGRLRAGVQPALS